MSDYENPSIDPEHVPAEKEEANPYEGMIDDSPVSDTRAQRFYDRIRASIASYITKNGEKTGKKGELLFFVPDVFILLWRLANDKRVTGKNKLLLGTGIAYFIFPLDIVPEALLGPIGYLDDLVFAVYILNRLLTDTDEEIVRSHWSGDTDLLDMMQRVLHSADQLVAKDVLKQIRKLVK